MLLPDTLWPQGSRRLHDYSYAATTHLMVLLLRILLALPDLHLCSWLHLTSQHRLSHSPVSIATASSLGLLCGAHYLTPTLHLYQPTF